MGQSTGTLTGPPGLLWHEEPPDPSGTIYVSEAARPGGTGSRDRPYATLQQALQKAKGGDEIHLAGGRYPQMSVTSRFSSYVTITGAGDETPPMISGALITGAAHVRFNQVEFTAQILINRSLTGRGAQSAENIQLLNSEIDCRTSTAASARTGFTQGIYLRGGARNVEFTDDYVHNCTVGFGSQAQDPLTTNLSITHCTFQGFNGDAIDLGGLSGVVIDHDIIRDMADPGSWYHDDGIQFFGNVTNVQITNNVLANSRVQLIFIQDAIKGSTTDSSVNRNILIAHNLIYGAGGYAVQDQGGQNVSFIGNTMWNNHYGSVLVEPSSFTGLSPTVKIADNIIQSLTLANVTAQYEDYNLLTNERLTTGWGSDDIINQTPSFVAPKSGDFRLAHTSPGGGAGNTEIAQTLTKGNTNVAADISGGAASPWYNIGYSQPHDPDVSYGPASFGLAPLL